MGSKLSNESAGSEAEIEAAYRRRVRLAELQRQHQLQQVRSRNERLEKIDKWAKVNHSKRTYAEAAAGSCATNEEVSPSNFAEVMKFKFAKLMRFKAVSTPTTPTPQQKALEEEGGGGGAEGPLVAVVAGASASNNKENVDRDAETESDSAESVYSSKDLGLEDLASRSRSKRNSEAGAGAESHPKEVVLTTDSDDSTEEAREATSSASSKDLNDLARNLTKPTPKCNRRHCSISAVAAARHRKKTTKNFRWNLRPRPKRDVPVIDVSDGSEDIIQDVESSVIDWELLCHQERAGELRNTCEACGQSFSNFSYLVLHRLTCGKDLNAKKTIPRRRGDPEAEQKKDPNFEP